MIDDKKIVSMLQAKALGCLDETENNELQNFIDSGFVFPWDQLGLYQNTAALLPLTLHLEIPDTELKDKVALKLIKLSEEIKAKKIAEEEQLKALQQEELIEEEVEEKQDEFLNLDEPFIDPPIEIETEQQTEITDIKFSGPVNLDESSFNLDDIMLPGYETENLSEPVIESTEIENNFESSNLYDITSEVSLEKTDVDEVKLPELKVETETVADSKMSLPEIEQFIVENNWIEPEIKNVDVQKTPVVSIPPPIPVLDSKLVEENEDLNKPDLTKRSVAEKVFKTLEQDFDRLKYHFETTERKLKHSQLIVYLVIAFLAALLIVLFFKFNSDIERQQKEIDFLKSRPSSINLDIENITLHHFC